MSRLYNSEFTKKWHKDCPKCGDQYDARSRAGLSKFFYSSFNKSDGLDCVCKACKNKQKKIYLAGNPEERRRNNVRKGTKKKHGPASKQKCVFCFVPAEHWHHVEYKIDSAIPVCKPCHEAQHIVR